MIFLDISASEPFLCMMKYDAVIFDLGGVVLNLDYSATTRAFENLGLKDFSKLYSHSCPKPTCFLTLRPEK